MRDLAAAGLVLLGLVLITLLAFGVTLRWAFRGFVMLVALAVAATLFLHSSDVAASELSVSADSAGGWTVTIPDIDGANEYIVDLDGVTVLRTSRPGALHVDDYEIKADDYAPDPVRQFRVRAKDRSGNTKATLESVFCAPVVMLAARGTLENPGALKYAHGIGSRAWGVWHDLAVQLGVSPPTDGVEPSVVAAAPIHYPAAVWGVTAAIPYVTSRNKGIKDLERRWAAVRDNCPDSAIILFGYSQGADVVASSWLSGQVDHEGTTAVVLVADPHFNRAWQAQGITRPEGAVYKKNGGLGARPRLPSEDVALIEAWCWPGDHVCQGPLALPFHGDEYDVYEEWIAFSLAQRIGPILTAGGRTIPNPVPPTRMPSVTGR